MVGVSNAFGASLILGGDLCENPDGSYGSPPGAGFTAPGSEVWALTADGLQGAADSVSCYPAHNGARVPARVWMPYGGPPNILEMSWKGGGMALGIGIAAGGNIVMSLNVGSSNYSTGNIGRYSLNGTSYSAIKDHKGKTSEALVSQNSVSPDGKYIFGYPMRSSRKYGYIWDTNNGTSVGNATRVKGAYTGKMAKWNSGSTVNTAVGQDRSGNYNSKDGAIYCYSITGKAVHSIPALAGMPSWADRGQGRGISDNGQYLTGYLYATYITPPDPPYLYTGFRWSPGDATSTMLKPYGSDLLCWGGDVADNGMVVGWSHGEDPAGQDKGYDAAFWPIPSICVLLKNYLDSQGVDTSEWKSLAKVWVCSADGLIMAGYGKRVDGTIRSFIADLRSPIEMDLDIQPDSIVTTNTNKARLPIHLYGTEDTPGEDIILDSIMIEDVVEPVKVKVVDLDLDGINDVKIHISREDLKNAMNLQAEPDGQVVTVTMTATRAGDYWPLEASDTLVCDRAD
jgi:hypothetical protein